MHRAVMSSTYGSREKHTSRCLKVLGKNSYVDICIITGNGNLVFHDDRCNIDN